MARDTPISFLRNFVVDQAVLEWHPGSGASDLTKKVHDVFLVMKDDPAQLPSKAIKKIIYDKDSQIEAKEDRLNHYYRVAGINKQLVGELKERHPDLDLPDDLNISYSLGLIHDLTNAYVKWGGEFDQQEKELPLYFHGKYMGVEIIAEAAMHNAYFEIAEMICDGQGFAKVGFYKDKGWTAALRDQSNPYNFQNIKREFSGFIQGLERMSLITLTLADCLDDMEARNQRVCLDNMSSAFNNRISDIMYRNYCQEIKAGRQPTAFGIALKEKSGLARLHSYLALVDDLLHNRKVDQYRETRPGLWKR